MSEDIEELMREAEKEKPKTPLKDAFERDDEARKCRSGVGPRRLTREEWERQQALKREYGDASPERAHEINLELMRMDYPQIDAKHSPGMLRYVRGKRAPVDKPAEPE